MRADHVGAYGYAAARTPTLDRIAREGARFDRAFAPSPITLTSHASLLTGLYPPGHGARDNGMAMAPTVATLATALRDRGFATAAFIAAFPLDRRFGLARGFDVYADRMPRGSNGRLANERPGREVVDEAIAWFEKALARSPGFVEARLNLGIALQQAGQAARARTTYREVLAAPSKYRQQKDAAAKLLKAMGK